MGLKTIEKDISKRKDTEFELTRLWYVYDGRKRIGAIEEYYQDHYLMEFNEGDYGVADNISNLFASYFFGYGGEEKSPEYGAMKDELVAVRKYFEDFDSSLRWIEKEYDEFPRGWKNVE